MQETNAIFESLAKLFCYPESEKLNALPRLKAELQQSPEALLQIQPFVDFAKSAAVTELEELFTRSFDLNPSCCLEMGWHLFGEDYERGRFLVHMRESLREHGIAESLELPDHISHCLHLLARLPEDEAALFAKKYLQPGLSKVLDNLEADNPYRGLLSFLAGDLERRYGAPEPVREAGAAAGSALESKLNLINCSC